MGRPPGGAMTLGTLGLEPRTLGDVSPVTFASEGDPPTLIIHGDQDRVVPIQQGRLMRDVLHSAGVTTELIVIEGAGHGFSGQDAQTGRAATLEWFERYLN